MDGSVWPAVIETYANPHHLLDPPEIWKEYSCRLWFYELWLVGIALEHLIFHVIFSVLRDY